MKMYIYIYIYGRHARDMPQRKWMTEWGREMQRETVRDKKREEEQENHGSPEEGIWLGRAGLGLGRAKLYKTLQHQTTLKYIYTIPCLISRR